jgi:hypothetical protein
MNAENGFVRKLYDDYVFIALLPVIAVIIDYTLTFYLAGDTSMITSWEASPLVRFAVINNVMAAYLAAIVLFYFSASYVVLRVLSGTEYYKFGFLLIITMSITHVIGGMSWYFRNALYSNGVFIMSLLSIVIAFVLFGFSLMHERIPA